MPQDDLNSHPCVNENRQELQHIDVQETNWVRLVACWFVSEDRNAGRLEVGRCETAFEVNLHTEPPKPLI